MKRFPLLVLLSLVAYAQEPAAQELADAPAPDGIRPGGTLTRSAQAPPIPRERTEGQQPARSFPKQPPTIPHSIRGYQMDRNVNQCLSCHSRRAAKVSGAPMVSVTHFWDRDGQPLAAVSPRSYFCVQCHVPQHQLQPVKRSTFIGIDTVLQKAIKSGK